MRSRFKCRQEIAPGENMATSSTKKISQYDIITDPETDDSAFDFIAKKYESISKQIDERLMQLKIKRNKEIKN